MRMRLVFLLSILSLVFIFVHNSVGNFPTEDVEQIISQEERDAARIVIDKLVKKKTKEAKDRGSTVAQHPNNEETKRQNRNKRDAKRGKQQAKAKTKGNELNNNIQRQKMRMQHRFYRLTRKHSVVSLFSINLTHPVSRVLFSTNSISIKKTS